jgi:hypothetical protein
MLGYLSQGLVAMKFRRKWAVVSKRLAAIDVRLCVKVNISRYSDFVLWLGTQSVSAKYTEVVNNHERDADEDQLIWKTTLSGDMEQQLDDKERALQSIKRLVT